MALSTFNSRSDSSSFCGRHNNKYQNQMEELQDIGAIGVYMRYFSLKTSGFLESQRINGAI